MVVRSPSIIPRYAYQNTWQHLLHSSSIDRILVQHAKMENRRSDLSWGKDVNISVNPGFDSRWDSGDTQH